MKLVVSVLIILFVAQKVLSSKYFKDQADYCIFQHSLNAKAISEIHTSKDEIKDNDDYHVFIECYWKRLGFLTRDGNLNYRFIWQTYFQLYKIRFGYVESKKRVETLIARCDQVTGKTLASKIINMSNCISESV